MKISSISGLYENENIDADKNTCRINTVTQSCFCGIAAEKERYVPESQPRARVADTCIY